MRFAILVILYYPKYLIEYLYSRYLAHTRKDPYFITNEILEKIKRISKVAYPGEKMVYEKLNTVDDMVANGFFCRKEKVYVLTGDDWYFLLQRHITHIFAYDFASSTGKCPDIFRVYSELLSLFSGRRGILYCKTDTSYPVLLQIAKRGYIRVYKDIPGYMNGVPIHRIHLKVIRQPKRRKTT